LAITFINISGSKNEKFCETIIDADKVTLKKIVDFIEKHCPVSDTLRSPIPVTGKVVAKRNGQKINIV